MVSLFGKINVPIAWPVSANARKKLLNMETGVKASQDINVRCSRREHQKIHLKVWKVKE